MRGSAIRAGFRISIMGQSFLLGILIVSLVAIYYGAGIYPIVAAAPLSQSHFDYVVIIVMNNASSQSIYGNPSAPYLNSLAKTYGYATAYAAVDENAVPNYLALVGGSTFVPGACEPTECPINAVNIVDRIEGAGLTWKAWGEDYPLVQGCFTGEENFGYRATHFPFVYFQDIINSPGRCNNLLKANSQVVLPPGTEMPDLFLDSLSSTTTAANYMWLTPNACASLHQCSISIGDTYLSDVVPKILQSTIFTTQKAALFITFAEGASPVPSPTDFVPAIWAGPAAKTGFVSSSPYNHYSFLKTVETAWGLSALTSNDGGASSMGEFFKLQAGFTYTPSAPVADRTVTFTGTGTGGTTPYTFAWTFGDGATGTGNPATHTYASQGSYSVKLKATDSNGATVTITNTVSVLPEPPPLTADFTSTPASPEVGVSTSFSASQTGGVSPYTYTWTFGDGSPTASGSPTSHTYTDSGSFTVALTVIDADGLSATASHTLVVAARLGIVGVIATPNPTEAGLSVSFSATTSGGAGTMTFGWNFGDGSPPGSGNPASHTYTDAGTYDVTVTVTDGNGVTATRTVSESVNARLAVDPVASTDQALVDQAITFDSQTTGGVPLVSCSWSFGDGTTATACIATHAYSVAGNFTATVTATDALEITATGTVFVSVSDACGPNFTWNPLSPEGGQLVTFTATTKGKCVSPVSFAWEFGDGNTGSGNPASHTYPNAGGTFTVTVTVTDADGVTATKSIPLTIAARLTVNFATSPSAPEGGQTITFTATTAGGVGAKTCSWNFGDGGTANGCTVTHIYGNSGGTFTVQVTASDGNAVTAVASQGIVIVPRLSAVLQATPNPASVDTTVTLTVVTTGGVGPFTCSSWKYGDGDTSSSTSCTKTHTYSTTGTFNATVSVTDSNSVKTTGSVLVLVTDTCSVAFTYSPTFPEGGVPIVFTATTRTCVSPAVLAWDFGDGATGSGSSVTHTYSDAGGTPIVVLTATDPEAYQSTSSQTITVAARLAVSFTSSPSSPEGGQVVTFTASTTGGVGTKTCSWTFGDGSTAVGCGTTHTYANAGGTFAVSVNAADSNAVTAGSSQTVLVAARLAVNFAFSPTAPEGGLLVTFTAVPTGGVGSASCAWTFGDGGTADTCTATHPFADAGGTFAVKVTATDDNAVTVTSLQTILIPSRLGVNFSLTPSSPEGGHPVTFTAVSTGGVGLVTYSWEFGDGSSGIGNPATTAYASQGGTFTVTVTATDENSVIATISRTVVVARALSVSFTFNPATPEGGQTLAFMATPTDGVGTKTCSWDFGDGSTASGCITTHLYSNPGGDFTVTVTATDGNSVAASSSQSLFISPRLAAADFTLAPSLPEAGLTVTFKGSQTGGVAPYSYSWNLGDGSQTASGNSVDHTYAVSGSFTVILTVMDANGVTVTVSKTVEVTSLLAVSFTFSPGAPEGGQTVTFTATFTGGVGAVSYSWDFRDGSPSGSGNPTTHVYDGAGGTFAVIVTAVDANGVTAVASRSVVVAPRLTVGFSFNQDTPLGGQTLAFTATTNGGVGTKTCSWSFGDGGTATGCTTTHTYAIAGGTFTVTVTASDANSVTASASRFVVIASHLSGADFTFTPGWPEAGVSVSFTATHIGGLSPYTYSWNFGDDSPIGYGSPMSHTYTISGTFTVALTVRDAYGDTGTATHTIRVVVDNMPPVFSDLSTFRSTTVGQALTFGVAAVDPEGGPVLIVAQGLPAGASFDPSNGQFSWTPATDEAGNHTITFTAFDGVTPPKTISQLVTIQVKPGPRQYTILGVPLDERALAGVAVVGLVVALAAAVFLGIRNTGQFDRTEPEDDYDESKPRWEREDSTVWSERLVFDMEESE